MKETSPDEPYIDRLRTWAQSKVHGGDRSTARRPTPNSNPDLLPITNNTTNRTTSTLDTSASSHNGKGTSDHAVLHPSTSHVGLGLGVDDANGPGGGSSSSKDNGPHNGPGGGLPASKSPQASRKGSQLDSGPPSQNEKSEENGTGADAAQDGSKDKPNVLRRFLLVFRKVLFHSWINVLLVFVPVGIAVNFVPGISPGVIFAMNAIAIIPLAGLLSHATETVAHRFGDAIGALMNVTFGNAVELIILYVIARHVPGALAGRRGWSLPSCSLPRHRHTSSRRPAGSRYGICNTVANLFCSMYVRLAKVIKTRSRREKPVTGIIKSKSRPISLTQ